VNRIGSADVYLSSGIFGMSKHSNRPDLPVRTPGPSVLLDFAVAKTSARGHRRRAVVDDDRKRYREHFGKCSR